jgi:hypothetical protein
LRREGEEAAREARCRGHPYYDWCADEWFTGTFGGLGGAKGGAKDKFIRFYDVFDEVVERHRIGKVRSSLFPAFLSPNSSLSFPFVSHLNPNGTKN